MTVTETPRIPKQNRETVAGPVNPAITVTVDDTATMTDLFARAAVAQIDLVDVLQGEIEERERELAAQAAAERAARPFWQKTPCPSYCGRKHSSDDRPHERVHEGLIRSIVLSRGEMVTFDDPRHKDDDDRPTGSVWLREWASHKARPDVFIELATGGDFLITPLTPWEARELAVALLRMADLADGVDSDMSSALSTP